MNLTRRQRLAATINFFMIVITPHPTEELILIHEQKKLIASMYAPGKIVYAHTPLWIDTEFESVEQAKKEITTVIIETPEYDENEECIVCPVKINTVDGKVLESKLVFIHGRNVAVINVEDGTFPLTLKIFRLGECNSPKPGVYELSSVVWKKTSSKTVPSS